MIDLSIHTRPGDKTMSDNYSPGGLQERLDQRRQRSNDISSREDLQERLDQSRQRTQEARERSEELTAPYRAQQDYYASLRNQYSDMPGLRDEDYLFLDNIQPLIAASPNPKETRDRFLSAAAFSQALGIPLDSAYINLDMLTEQWTGETWTPTTGLKATLDSLVVGLLGFKHNSLSIKYHESGQDPEVLRELEEVEREIESRRDRMPKIWQDEYIHRGGWADVAGFFRTAFTLLGENAPNLALLGVSANLAATGIGTFAAEAGLSTAVSNMLVTGGAMLTTAGLSYGSTVGTEYRQLITEGIPDDIAWTVANVSSVIQAAIETVGTGVAGTAMRGFINMAAPGAIGKAFTNFFIKNKGGLLAKAAVGYVMELGGEFFEEGAQTFTSAQAYNWAADQTMSRREAVLRQLYGQLNEDVRKELEAELEKYPELEKKDLDEIWGEVWDASWGGFATAIILGGIGAGSTYLGDVANAKVLAAMARDAPNDAAFLAQVQTAEEAGEVKIPGGENLSPEDKRQYLTSVRAVQQARLSPEQRAARERDSRAIAAGAEVTDYSNVAPETRVDEATGEVYETGEHQARVAPEIYRENGRLAFDIDQVEQDDGTVRGEFVVGNPTIPDEGNREPQYGHIDYTVEGDRVRIDRFQMLEGYEDLRVEAYREFAQHELIAGKEIVWDPSHDANLQIRQKLVEANPRGPQAGLNYGVSLAETPVSAEAREAARRIQPFLPKATPLETAMVAEAFNFMRRPGEDLNQAFERLGLSFTNEPGRSLDAAAQRRGGGVKGATWAEQTAEGMKRIIYLNRESADASTLAHELLHVAGKNLGESDIKALARALNGYTLRDGTAVAFDESSITIESFAANTAQQEAFSEAGENYLANGQAPTPD
jgi:hypothetical protein